MAETLKKQPKRPRYSLGKLKQKFQNPDAFLAALLEYSDDYILISDDQGFPLMFNSAYAKIINEALGIEMRPGLKPHTLLPDKKAAAWWEGLHRRVLSGEKFREVYNHDFGKEGIRHLEVSYCPIVKDGRVEGFIEITRDITKRKQAEDALRELEEKWYSILRNCPDIIVSVDRKGKVLFINRTISGMPVEEILGKSIYDFMSADAQKKARAAIYHSFKTGKVSHYEIQHQKPDGGIMWLDARVGPNVYKDAIHSASIVTTDVTERKRMEETLHESEVKWRSLAENAPAVILTVNRKGIIQFLSRTVGKYTPEESIGSSVYEYVPPDQHEVVRRAVEKVFMTGRPTSYEILGAGPKGPNSAWYQTNLGPIKIDGEVVSVDLIATDITDRKQAEKMLQEQKIALEQKNIALREVIAQIELEKNRIREDISSNVEELVLPLLKKIRGKGNSRKYLDLLRRHLANLSSSFGRKISDRRLRLSPREVEICDMIKGGLSGKEISELLGGSPQTVEKQRKSIRKKLRISKKKVNLTSFLQQM